jgi:hypothetical protein
MISAEKCDANAGGPRIRRKAFLKGTVDSETASKPSNGSC